MPRAKKPRLGRLGRPPRAGVNATETVKLRATPEERVRWQLAADRCGLTLGAWLREAAELAWVRGSTR